MEIAYSAQDILSTLGQDASPAGATNETITGIAALEHAGPGQLSFLGNKKYRNLVASCEASIILLPKDFEGEPKDNQLWLRVDNPSLALAKLCEEIEKLQFPPKDAVVHQNAVVHYSAKIGEGVFIGPFVVIEEGAQIGAGTVIQAHSFVGRYARIGTDCFFQPRVTFAGHCVAGDRVRLQSGCVIGSDGFGYETVDGKHQRVPQVGSVVLSDDVEVGANTTIDRARFDKTYIGPGTKIDNQVMLAHNVQTGQGCIIVAQAGVSGSTTLGNYVILAGQVGVVGHCKIGDGTQVGAQSGINHDIEPKSYVRGSPARPYMQQQRIEVCAKNLPALFKRVAKVEDLLANYEAQMEK